MSIYFQPIISALAVFFLLAMLVTTPWTIYQYRKHGYFSFWRNVILFSFVFYLLSAFFLVSLPLPVSRLNYVPGQSQVYSQWHLFQFLTDIQRESQVVWQNPRTYLNLLNSKAFFQAFFNLLLLFPLGVYYRFYRGSQGRFWQSLLIGGLFSLFIEISQRTALFGFYQVPYRLFDVDDLLINTLGAGLGYVLAPLVLFLLPSMAKIKAQDQVYLEEAKVSYGGQLGEVLINLFFARALSSLPMMIFKQKSVFAEELWVLISFMFLIVLLPSLWSGRTLAGQILNIRLIPEGNKNAYLKRFWLIYTPILASRFATYLSEIDNQSFELVISQVLCFFGVLLMWMIIYFDIFRKWLKGSPRPYFNFKSGVIAIRK